jgi:hypothetical protein
VLVTPDDGDVLAAELDGRRQLAQAVVDHPSVANGLDAEHVDVDDRRIGHVSPPRS